MSAARTVLGTCGEPFDDRLMCARIRFHLGWHRTYVRPAGAPTVAPWERRYVPPAAWSVIETVEGWLIAVLRLLIEDAHVATDPACRRFCGYPERRGLSKWWHDVNRGRSCRTCRDPLEGIDVDEALARLAAARAAGRRPSAPTPDTEGAGLRLIPGELDESERCVRTVDRLTCSTHGEAWPCPRLDVAVDPVDVHDLTGDGGMCPLDCGRYVARVLLEGHLELHRLRGDVGDAQ